MRCVLPLDERRFVRVLMTQAAPPRADFIHQAIKAREFTLAELADLMGDDFVRVTLTVALEYISAGSILVLGTRRAAYEGYLKQLAALRAKRSIKGITK